jgi:hypothetical protein
MTDAEHYQQMLEQQEQEEESVSFQTEGGNRVRLHIWGDDRTMFVNVDCYPLSMSVSLDRQHAKQFVAMVENAWRKM